MAIQAVSGIGATRTAETSPDFRFVWTTLEQGTTSLVVNCAFGGGTALNNHATATIPWGSSTPVTVSNQQSNTAIRVVGNVQAFWSGDQTSYVVLFTGAMVEGNVNNVFSYNVTISPPSEAPAIIVAATISH